MEMGELGCGDVSPLMVSRVRFKTRSFIRGVLLLLDIAAVEGNKLKLMGGAIDAVLGAEEVALETAVNTCTVMFVMLLMSIGESGEMAIG